jgi:hypothetical protein
MDTSSIQHMTAQMAELALEVGDGEAVVLITEAIENSSLATHAEDTRRELLRMRMELEDADQRMRALEDYINTEPPAPSLVLDDDADLLRCRAHLNRRREASSNTRTWGTPSERAKRRRQMETQRAAVAAAAAHYSLAWDKLHLAHAKLMAFQEICAEDEEAATEAEALVEEEHQIRMEAEESIRLARERADVLLAAARSNTRKRRAVSISRSSSNASLASLPSVSSSIRSGASGSDASDVSDPFGSM